MPDWEAFVSSQLTDLALPQEERADVNCRASFRLERFAAENPFRKNEKGHHDKSR